MEAWIAANAKSDEKAFNAHWKGLDKAGRQVRDTLLISNLI